MTRRLPFAAAFFSMLPFIVCLPEFRRLYWFHDDWHLLNEWAASGAPSFIAAPMGENFAPVFKAAWMGAVWLTRGNYLAMIGIEWATHLAILLLFAALLLRCQFPPAAATVAVLILGLAWSNIETLGWATQWSSLLCTLFLAIAWVEMAGKGRAALAIAAAAILFGGMCFGRGILSGALLAAFVWLRSRDWRSAAALAALSAVLLLPYAPWWEDRPDLRVLDVLRIGDAARWARDYLLLNPLYLLISFRRREVNDLALWIFGSLKILVIAAGVFFATRKQRSLLWTLLLFDGSTAVLLAAGRYGTGAIGEVSSRYQYISLFCLAPFAALCVARLPRRVAIGLATAMALGVFLPWKPHMERWSLERGVEVRQAIARTPDDRRFGLPTITAGRARELTAKFHLH